MRKLLLIFIIFVVSAASFEGFFVKWTFRDDNSTYSFQAMYEGTAERPFVYRQLLISVSKSIVLSLPDDTKIQIKNKIHEDNFLENNFKRVNIKDEFIIEYYTLYFLCFVCLFTSVFIWRQICADVTGSLTAGTLAALTFTILFPYLETNGGYYYDFPELLFFSAATLFAYRGYWIALILLSPIATYSKESFFFFLLTLYPILRINLSFKKTCLILTSAVFLAGITYFINMSHFANNPGGNTYFNLFNNLLGIIPIICFAAVYFIDKFKLILYALLAIIFIITKNYLLTQSFANSFEHQFLLNVYDSFGHTYSVISGEYAFFLHIILIVWFVKYSWQYLNDTWRTQAKLALLINTLLILPFGLVCELRNWSLLYPAFIVLISFNIKNSLRW